MADAIKMALAEKWLGGSWRKVLRLPTRERPVVSKSVVWRAEAMKQLGVEIIVVSLKIRSVKSVTKRSTGRIWATHQNETV